MKCLLIFFSHSWKTVVEPTSTAETATANESKRKVCATGKRNYYEKQFPTDFQLSKPYFATNQQHNSEFLGKLSNNVKFCAVAAISIFSSYVWNKKMEEKVKTRALKVEEEWKNPFTFSLLAQTFRDDEKPKYLRFFSSSARSIVVCALQGDAFFHVLRRQFL